MPDSCPNAPLSAGVSQLIDLAAQTQIMTATVIPMTNGGKSEWNGDVGIRVQWADADGDGFGDNAIITWMIVRIHRSSTIDLGLFTVMATGIDEFGFTNAQLKLMASNPTASYYILFPSQFRHCL